jgi:hypothetical protein
MPNRASEGDPGCTAIARRGGGRSIATENDEVFLF